MILVNHLSTLDRLDKNVIKTFLTILNPFAPHISEELNSLLGFHPILSNEWPDYDSNLIVEEKVTVAVQFNGKTRGTIEILLNTSEENVIKCVTSDRKLGKYFNGMTIIKTVNIPNKLINFVLKPN